MADAPMAGDGETEALLYTEDELRRAVLAFAEEWRSHFWGEGADEAARAAFIGDLQAFGNGTLDPAAFTYLVRSLWAARGVETLGDTGRNSRDEPSLLVRLPDGLISAPKLREGADSNWAGQPKPPVVGPGTPSITEMGALHFLRDFLDRWLSRGATLDSLIADLRSPEVLARDRDWRDALRALEP
ncbi:hypothetical protein [Diaminobutyricimonas aerilata]|uniref:hypothetical protein n=1 Tax=Diaminobutyricimonas aerilata TaxID=1162967 RepID=UPI000C23D456|nr:hypothetical protein [Diaminobutyricimonas aerilata]